MEIAEVRKQLHQMMERVRRAGVERRARVEQASREFEIFLNQTAVPLMRQIANVLRADGYMFTVFTPSGSVRLMSDRSAEDFIEILLDTIDDAGPHVVVRTSRGRGRRVVASERAVGSADPQALGEEELLRVLLTELEPFFER